MTWIVIMQCYELWTAPLCASTIQQTVSLQSHEDVIIFLLKKNKQLIYLLSTEVQELKKKTRLAKEINETTRKNKQLTCLLSTEVQESKNLKKKTRLAKEINETTRKNKQLTCLLSTEVQEPKNLKKKDVISKRNKQPTKKTNT